MAKATAICTCEKCGATFEKYTVKSNRRQADSWEEWAKDYYTVCPACEVKARDEKVAEIAAEARENGLPELRGTEKQNAWAEQIRKQKIDGINSWIEECRPHAAPEDLAKAEEVLGYILTIDTSRWWIDHRDVSAGHLLNECLPLALERKAPAAPTPSEEKEAEESTVITPENAQFGTATITVTNEAVEVRYPKDDTFRTEIKKAGFSWNSDNRCWEKKLGFRTGSGIDRAADVANRLLTAGFAVDCKDAEVRRMAADGSFEPECKRWITLLVGGEYKDWLAISIPRNDDESDSQKLYDESRRIKGSRWYKGQTAVPAAQYAEVEDFARIYGYKISEGAERRINEVKNADTIKARIPNKPEKVDVLGDILNSSAEVLDDLKD